MAVQSTERKLSSSPVAPSVPTEEEKALPKTFSNKISCCMLHFFRAGGMREIGTIPSLSVPRRKIRIFIR
ncbi:unnamed protein product [Larinioides sclopetarius]|uniref:Uncharacterized protein n=1 Tax=Larinioides sclopetarius TaxID=280406 RepID=A0AAV2BMN5_9ARAC